MSRGTSAERAWFKKREPYSVLVSQTEDNAYVAESGTTGEILYGPTGDARALFENVIASDEKILIGPGTYYINDDVPIGAISNFILKGSGAGTLLKIPDGCTTTLAMLNFSGAASKIKIEDIYFDGNRRTNFPTTKTEISEYVQVGVSFTGDTDGITIKNCWFRDFLHEGLWLPHTGTHTNTKISFNTFWEGIYGAWLEKAAGSIITNNHFLSHYQRCLTLSIAVSDICERNIIGKNYFYAVTDDASYPSRPINLINGMNDTIIAHNVIEGAAWEGILAIGDRNIITKNRITTYGKGNGNGISATGNDIIISGNILYSIGENGVKLLGPSSGVIIAHNIIDDVSLAFGQTNGKAAIKVDATNGTIQKVSIKHNLIKQPTAAKAQYAIATGWGTISDILCHDNDMYDTSNFSTVILGPNSIKDNRNFNPQAASTPTVPASPATFGPYSYRALLVITGGTVSSIALRGLATGLTSGSFVLEVGDTLVITYTSTPTVKLYPL